MRRTTVSLEPQLFAALRGLAAKQMRTLTEVVNELLRVGLQQVQRPPKRTPTTFPTFHTGRPLVNIADRDALYDAMEGR